MSITNKTPYIESVLGSLNATQLTEFKRLLNNQITHNKRSLFTNGELITNDDKGTPLRVDLELELGNIKSGILVYTTTYCVLIAYNRFQNVQLFNLDLAHQTYSKVDEECDVEEMRRVLDDSAKHGGDVWVEKMKEHLDYSEAGEGTVAKVECGTNLEVDGDVIVNAISDIVDTDGNTIIPDSEPNKVLVGGSSFVYQLETPAQLLQAPSTGTYVLKSVNGALTWVEEE